MTKKLESLFNLPQDEAKNQKPSNTSDDTPDGTEELDESQMAISTSLSELDKIEQALPAVRGLEASDKEIDDLSEKATSSFDDLMDLGMNVDSRYAADIFSVASTMLGHAVTAKNAKINKKLKTIDLQLKKMRLDQQGQKSETEESEHGSGVVLDRNQLLEKLLNKNSKDDNAKE